MPKLSAGIYDSWKGLQQEKYEAVFKKLRFSLIEGRKVIDIGAGPGFLRDFLEAKGVDCCLIALEPDRQMIRRKENMVLGRAEDMPFRDGAFDIALAFDSLHLIDKTDFLRTVRRGGMIIASMFHNDRNFTEREELITKKLEGCQITESFVLDSREKEFVVVARKST